MESKLGILLKVCGKAKAITLYDSDGARQEVWSNLSEISRKRRSKVIVDIRGQVLQGITGTQARALSFTDSMLGLTMSLAKAILQGDWKEAHRLIPLIVMDSQVLRSEVLPVIEIKPKGA